MTGVLIINPTSGGGKASHHDLASECTKRGIEPVLFQPGDNLTEMAQAAVARGADVIGMAGGDGSQAAVAAVAVAADVAFVCIPAGTRNHFAADIGVDRHDIVGALAAFIDGAERRIDLGRVNGRLFVNNVSMGVYGKAVQSKEYRNRKWRTVLDELPALVGRRPEPFDLHFTGPDGIAYDSAEVLLVANNRYDFGPGRRRGTRHGMNEGVLGMVGVTGPPPHGWLEWAAPAFQVDSSGPVPVGVDGEAVTIQPPLFFESVPNALMILTAARPLSRSGRRRPGP